MLQSRRRFGYSAAMSDEIALSLVQIAMPEAAKRLQQAAMERVKSISWFDFVPSDYEVVYTVLAALERGRFCEWGSGMGVATGLAEMLGYTAMGIEFHEPLVAASRALLSQFQLQARIELGDYYERTDQADLYFAYCWPGKVARTQKRFFEVAPPGARLLIYYGRSDIRWIAK